MSSRPLLLLSIIGAALSACGDEKPTLEIPRVGTEFVIIGAAGGGRSLGPLDLRVVRATTLETLEIPGTGNADVDMVFAGIAPEDLPKGLSPDAIQFVVPTAPKARRFPKLTKPHVLETPSPPGTAGVLVPVEDAAAGSSVMEERQERLRKLLSGLSIVDPCVEPSTPFNVFTPRTQASAIGAIKVMSTGETMLGLAATSTAILGVLARSSMTVKQLGVATGSVAIAEGEAATILSLSEDEADDGAGKKVPALLTMVRGRVLGHLARWSAQDRKYVDDTPRLMDSLPGNLSAAEYFDVDGTPSLCTYGSIEGRGAGLRYGGVWCRSRNGRDWKSAGEIQDSARLTKIVSKPGFPLLAFGLSGVVFAHQGRGRWMEVLRPAVNQACAVSCVVLQHVAAAPAGADYIAVVAGEHGETVILRGTSLDDLRQERISAIDGALFADERAGALEPLDFSAIAISPDGAIWLGATAPILVRVTPGLSEATRVCLPTDAGNGAVTAIAPAQDGRLILGMLPARIGIGTWQSP